MANELQGRDIGEGHQAFRRAFGARLREVRRRRKLTQSELAAALGCPAYMIGRYERAERFPPGAVLPDLRRVLKVSLDYLLVGISVSGVLDTRLLARFKTAQDLAPDDLAGLIQILDVHIESARRRSGLSLQAEPGSRPS